MEYETIVIPHKAESVSSTTSTDQPPSLYSGSSVCDADSPVMQDSAPFEDFLAIQIPHDDDQKPFFVDGFNKDHSTMLSQCKHVTIPASPGPIYDQPLTTMTTTKKRRASESTDDEERDEKRYKAMAANRELLTEEEKRANHIASEQKRRNTIRSGFKEMTDIIPTLKNINNSKSTILFKAVEYIKHLEKRNRNLREKIGSLHMRVEVKRRMGTLDSNDTSTWSQRRNTFSVVPADSTAGSNQQRRSSDAMTAALMAHKSQQQKQLELLQEQLRVQQELLAKHNIPSMSIPSSNNPVDTAPPSSLYIRLQQEKALRRYNSISIPAEEQHHTQHIHTHHNLHYSSTVNNTVIPTTIPNTSTSYTPALVVPASAADWESPSPPDTAPSLNIPADDEFHAHHDNNALLSRSKLEQMHKQ